MQGDNSTDQRKLFNASKKLLGKCEMPYFPGHLDKTVLANDIGTFFMRKIENIRRDTNARPISPSHLSFVHRDRLATDITGQTLHSFYTLNEHCINDLIKNSAKKSCTLDPWPSTLVCDALDVVLPVITYVVNASLSTGHFPDVWKEAIVSPLHNKGAKDTTHKNLRPVSKLQFISKITERAAFDQAYNHVTVNELFPRLQSAFRRCSADKFPN